MLTPIHKPTSMQDWRLETNSVQSRWLLATGEGNYKIPPNMDFQLCNWADDDSYASVS